jgi:hypothetical protein
MPNETVELNFKGIDQFIRALKEKLPTARVGILGDKDKRSDGSASNAEIGAKHEFGQDGMPVRSFLRIPIKENLQKYLEKTDAFNPDVLKKIISGGTVLPWVEKIALVAETIVSDAFDTGGFGQWQASRMAGKKNQQTLVETQQLRNSISSEVK